MLFGSSLTLLETAQGCVQLDLIKVENTNGVITDYKTPEDEIKAMMGVGREVMLTWELEGFQPAQFYEFPHPGVLTMPCFRETGVFWLEVSEVDILVDDKMQVAIACKNFQIGLNDIVIDVIEDNAGIATVATVINNTFGTSFRFGGVGNAPAQYTFTFNATQNCSLLDNQK